MTTARRDNPLINSLVANLIEDAHALRNGDTADPLVVQETLLDAIIALDDHLRSGGQYPERWRSPEARAVNQPE